MIRAVSRISRRTISTVASEAEHATGVRLTEMKSHFNKEPIVPPANAGTKENPILVS